MGLVWVCVHCLFLFRSPTLCEAQSLPSEPREWGFSGDLMFQKLVKIEDMADVAVSFILEEWGHLDQSQKSLYRDDRKENYGSMTSMGKNDFVCVV